MDNNLTVENYQLAARNYVLRTVVQEVVNMCEVSGRNIPGDDAGLQLDRLRAALAGKPLPIDEDRAFVNIRGDIEDDDGNTRAMTAAEREAWDQR